MDKRVFLGFAAEEDTIWYFHPQINMIVQMRLPKMEVIFKRVIKQEEFSFVPLAFSDVCLWKHFIIFAPWDAAEILLFNRRDNKIETILIETEEGSNAHFIKMLRSEDRLYFIPCCYGAILELDLNTRSLQYHGKIMTDYSIDIKGAFGEPAMIGNQGILPVLRDNKLLLVDLHRDIVERVTEIGEHGTWLRSVTSDENYIYILPVFERKLYIADVKGNVCEEVLLEAESHETVEWLTNVFDCSSYLLIVQRFGSKSYIVEKESWKVSEFDLFHGCAVKDRRITYAYKAHEYILAVLAGDYTKVSLYDIDNRQIFWRDMPKWESGFMSRRLQDTAVLWELGTGDTLHNYIGALGFMDYKRSGKEEKGTIGKRIYKTFS